MGKLLGWAWWALAGMAGLLMFAAQISRNEAQSNLATWLPKTLVDYFPVLKSAMTDKVVFSAALILLIALIGYAAIRWIRSSRRASLQIEDAAVAKAIFVKVGPGANVKGLEISGNTASGFEEVEWLDNQGSIEGGAVTDNHASAQGFKPSEVPVPLRRQEAQPALRLDQNVNVHGVNSGTIAPTYNNTINQAPAPEVKWSPRRATMRDDKYESTYDFEVVSLYPIKGIWLEVYGNSVSKLMVDPHSLGLATFGWSGQRDTHAFTTIHNAQGWYTLQFTSENDDVRVKYGFE